MTNPSLIEVTRGPLVESAHTGALAVATPDGSTLIALGDVDRPVYPRSGIKALQCLPLIETGAAERFGYRAPEIALACASHTGTERHTHLAHQMLIAAGLDELALGCGAHEPLGAKAARVLARNGGLPTQLHNNCSGKHAAMLATAVHLDEPVDGYWDYRHPVQERIRVTLSDLADVDLSAPQMGIDGCCVPTWAMPISALAMALARFSSGQGLGTLRQSAAQRIMASCWAEPELVAGPGRADTLAMARLPGRVFIKTGAEGVYCGALPKLGLGFAVKIDDGATRASAGVALALVERLYPEARGLVDRQTLKSWRGAEIGRIRSSRILDRSLDELVRSHYLARSALT